MRWTPLWIVALVGVAIAAACAAEPPSDQAHALLTEGARRVEAVLQERVTDPARRERALAAFAAYQDAEHAYFDELAGRRAELAALTADHAAPRADFERVLTRLDDRRAAFLDFAAAHLTRLRAELDAAEWRAVAACLAEMDAQWEAMVR